MTRGRMTRGGIRPGQQNDRERTTRPKTAYFVLRISTGKRPYPISVRGRPPRPDPPEMREAPPEMRAEERRPGPRPHPAPCLPRLLRSGPTGAQSVPRLPPSARAAPARSRGRRPARGLRCLLLALGLPAAARPGDPGTQAPPSRVPRRPHRGRSRKRPGNGVGPRRVDRSDAHALATPPRPRPEPRRVDRPSAGREPRHPVARRSPAPDPGPTPGRSQPAPAARQPDRHVPLPPAGRGPGSRRAPGRRCRHDGRHGHSRRALPASRRGGRGHRFHTRANAGMTAQLFRYSGPLT